MDSKITRRTFQTALAALPAAAAGGAPQQARQQGPLRIVTTYQFEPFEIEKIKTAAPGAAVEIIMCNSREEFRGKLREADVVYGNFNGPDLDYAPRLKWFQAGGAGMEWMDDKLRQSPIVVTNYARTPSPLALLKRAWGCCYASREDSRNTTCRSSPSGR